MKTGMTVFGHAGTVLEPAMSTDHMWTRWYLIYQGSFNGNANHTSSFISQLTDEVSAGTKSRDLRDKVPSLTANERTTRGKLDGLYSPGC